MNDATRFTVVLGVTGSIAAYKAADIIRQLRALRDPLRPERRVDVRVILTANGAQFITPLTLHTLSNNPVNQEQFAPPTQWNVEHIGLADDADLLLVAPASANMLAKLRFRLPFLHVENGFLRAVFLADARCQAAFAGLHRPLNGAKHAQDVTALFACGK
jgi:phosphopantothenoylcysteine synthetase/decarboxylase